MEGAPLGVVAFEHRVGDVALDSIDVLLRERDGNAGLRRQHGRDGRAPVAQGEDLTYTRLRAQICTCTYKRLLPRGSSCECKFHSQRGIANSLNMGSGWSS